VFLMAAERIDSERRILCIASIGSRGLYVVFIYKYLYFVRLLENAPYESNTLLRPAELTK
jgi:hypothetical protein